MTEDIDRKIEELQLVKEAQENEKRLEAHKQERLALLKHPFVMRVRDVMMENGYVHVAKLKKELHNKLEVQKQEVKNDLNMRVAAELKAQAQDITKGELTDMVTKILKEQAKPKNVDGVV